MSIQNPVGRLVRSATSNTRTVNSYDAMGRVRDQWQCTPVNCGTGWYTAHYDYNLAGGNTSASNPMGFTLTQQFDAAARLSQIISSWNDAQHPAALATVNPAVGYYPHGAIRKMTLGNGITETSAYNNRLQPCRLEMNSSSTHLTQCTDAAPSGNILDFGYGFNAGTLMIT